MRLASLVLAFSLGLPALVATGCGGSGKQVQAPAASLYDRLGQKPAIEVVVDKFLANVVADTRINAFFAHLDQAGVAKLRGHLIDQVCQATGGPCTYGGKTMRETHAGMGITEEQFGALVEDLSKALDEAGARPADRDELLGALAGMKPDIVGL